MSGHGDHKTAAETIRRLALALTQPGAATGVGLRLAESYPDDSLLVVEDTATGERYCLEASRIPSDAEVEENRQRLLTQRPMFTVTRFAWTAMDGTSGLWESAENPADVARRYAESPAANRAIVETAQSMVAASTLAAMKHGESDT